jgi:thiol-disulfide isomerase/thioredoxin
MKKLFLTMLIVACAQVYSQDSETTVVLDEDGNLIGTISRENFLVEPFSEWFLYNYDDYEVNETIVESLAPLLNGITIKAFMGTWCSDSQEQTPVFYKVLDACEFNEDSLEIVAVNEDKITPDNLQNGFEIVRVPTFIFYKNGKEIGRIVEYPQESIEADMLTILSGKPYKHSYEN